MTCALTGCAATGGLRQAQLAGQCAADDVACARRHPQAPIAIGARFYPEVSTALDGTTTPILRIDSASPNVLAVDGESLVARSPGASAVLISTDDGSVVDFIHMWAAQPTSLTVSRRDGERVTAPIALAVGEDVTLAPALWSGPQRLAGDGDVQWTVAGSPAGGAAPIAILRDGSRDRRRLRARVPGRTSVVVSLGDVSTTLDVEVVP